MPWKLPVWSVRRDTMAHVKCWRLRRHETRRSTMLGALKGTMIRSLLAGFALVTALGSAAPALADSEQESLKAAEQLSAMLRSYETYQARFIQIVVDSSGGRVRSEEHTSELQSRPQLVCRLLPEKKNRVTMLIPPLKTYSLTLKHERPPLTSTGFMMLTPCTA